MENQEPTARRKRGNPGDDELFDASSPPLCEPTAPGTTKQVDSLESTNKALNQLATAPLLRQLFGAGDLMRIVPFSGEETDTGYTIQDFVDRFALVTRACFMTDKERAVSVPLLLTGRALSFYATLAKDVQKDFGKTTRALLEEFSDPQAQRLAALRLRHLRLEKGEDIGKFAAELRKLTARAYPTLDECGKDRLLCDEFLLGLPLELRAAVLDRDPDNFKQAYDIASRIMARRKLCEEEARLRATDGRSSHVREARTDRQRAWRDKHFVRDRDDYHYRDVGPRADGGRSYSREVSYAEAQRTPRRGNWARYEDELREPSEGQYYDTARLPPE